MHEVSLCRAVAATVARHADGRPVTKVCLRVGHLRQVVPDSMQFAWQAVTATTPLEGAALEIDDVPAVVRCRDCGAESVLDWPILACGSCDSRAVDLLSGEELLVASIDVCAGAA